MQSRAHRLIGSMKAKLLEPDRLSVAEYFDPLANFSSVEAFLTGGPSETDNVPPEINCVSAQGDMRAYGSLRAIEYDCFLREILADTALADIDLCRLDAAAPVAAIEFGCTRRCQNGFGARP
jgi:hypothetical protein